MDDQRAYRIHSISLVNIDDTVFRQYQAHSQRGQIAAAHYLGLLDTIRDGIRQLGATPPGAVRLTQEAWDTQEAILRAQGLNEALIQSLRELQGPADQGIAALPAELAELWDDLGRRQRFVERAAVFDRDHLPRITVEDQRERLTEVGEHLAASSVDAAASQARALGIEEISVTWEFPIAKAAFGYTREQHDPGQAQLMGFWRRGHIENKFPIYAAASNTEAVLVTLAPTAVLSFVQDQVGIRRDETGNPRLILLRWMIEEPAIAEIVHTLTHSLSHLLLRGLDDGQIGLAEGGLAEWLVPEALSFAIYADNVRDFTLGSLWTLLTNRALSWLEGVPARALSCENDPLCHQGSPRRCERCLYLTFGCPQFNDGLDRSLVADFLRHHGALGAEAE
ncbi:hypothetical protein AB0K16_44210 [Nonomuraea jabiensis]|uniref:hypothetical protein n=1 Tax=Nonomuraea jabiensis TaxID=882448 RepID=UPI00342732CE